MFDDRHHVAGDTVPGSGPAADGAARAATDRDGAPVADGGRPAVGFGRPPRPEGCSRPWLAEDRCFQEVIAALPGGPVLAQVLPALLALEPARPGVAPEPCDADGFGEHPWVEPFEASEEHPLASPDDGFGEPPGADSFDGSSTAGPAWPATGVEYGGTDSDAFDAAEPGWTVDPSAPPTSSGPVVGAPGVPAGLPLTVTALLQCLEALPAAEGVPVRVGTAPARTVLAPVGGLVDPGRLAREEELTVGALAEMETSAVVEVVAAFKRIEAWAAGQAGRAAAMLAARDELDPCTQRVIPAAAGRAAALRAPAVATATLAKRLGTSGHAAGVLVRTGLELNGTLYATGEALAAGEIDWPKATILATALAGVPWHVAHAVEDAVLPTAATCTPGRLRQAVAKALQAVDPTDAADRHTRARHERRVERPTPLPDGMALVRAVLPADAAVRLDATLQAAAEHAKAGGDRRLMDQLRADALDALTTHAWSTGTINPGPCSRPCCSEPPSPADPAPAAGTGTSGIDAFAALLGPDARGAPTDSMKLAHIGKRAQINVTVDLTTLLGLTENPGHLAGYGPISADMARELARDATWRRLITDPVTGMVIDVATTRYRPPANLDELVRLRYPTCIDPVCAVPSDRCDLDHHAAWTPGDPDTSAPNLGPLCRTHHLHKTHAGVDYVEIEPGSHEITTPTGHRYRTAGHPLGLTGPPGTDTAPATDPDDHPPPF